MLITFTVKDQTDELIEGAKVKVFTLAGVFTVEGETDVAGAVVLDLNENDYVARVSLATTPYVAPAPFAFTVVIAGNYTFILRMTVLALPSADNPNYCRVSGTLYNEDPITTKVVLERVWPQVLLTAASQVSFLSNPYTLSVEDGYCVADLLKGARYRVNLSKAAKRWWMEIPDLSAADIGSVLFPLVKTITPDSVLVGLAVGEEAEVTYSQLYYSGLLLSSAALQAGSSPERQFDELSDGPSIAFTSSDEAVVTVEDDCGVLNLLGVGAGTATISVASADPWADVIRPDTDVEWVDLIEVTVA